MQLLSKTPQLNSCQIQFKFNLCTLKRAEPTFVECSCGEINCWCGDDFEDFFSYLICHCLSQKLVRMALEKSGTHKEVKVNMKSQFFKCNHYKFSEFRVHRCTRRTYSCIDYPKIWHEDLFTSLLKFFDIQGLNPHTW